MCEKKILPLLSQVQGKHDVKNHAIHIPYIEGFVETKDIATAPFIENIVRSQQALKSL